MFLYFGPLRITWLKLERSHPAIWLPVFLQSNLLEVAVGRGIPIRRSNVDLISSWACC